MKVLRVSNVVPGSPPFCDVLCNIDGRVKLFQHIRMVISCNGWQPVMSDLLDVVVKWKEEVCLKCDNQALVPGSFCAFCVAEGGK